MNNPLKEPLQTQFRDLMKGFLEAGCTGPLKGDAIRLIRHELNLGLVESARFADAVLNDLKQAYPEIARIDTTGWVDGPWVYTGTLKGKHIADACSHTYGGMVGVYDTVLQRSGEGVEWDGQRCVDCRSIRIRYRGINASYIGPEEAMRLTK